MDEREQARLKMKAEANYERNLRYKDSRLRTIGLPTQELALQIAEKKFLAQKEREDGKAERARNAEIEEMLEKVARDEEELRRSKAAQMKYEWDAQIKEKDAIRLRTRQNEKDSFNNDTPMIFSGDDPMHDERVAQQRDQLRRWTLEDMEEKAYRRAQERAQDLAQAQLNVSIDEMRLQQQEEEDMLKKEVLRNVLLENNELGEIKNKLKEEEYRRDHAPTNCTLVLGVDATTDENGIVSDKSHFRGYTSGQQKKLLMENEELIRLKKEREAKEKADEANWHLEQLRLQRIMAEVELENERVRNAYKNDIQVNLQEQVKEKKLRAKMESTADYGKIGGDFFANFGTSCR